MNSAVKLEADDHHQHHNHLLLHHTVPQPAALLGKLFSPPFLLTDQQQQQQHDNHTQQQQQQVPVDELRHCQAVQQSPHAMPSTFLPPAMDNNGCLNIPAEPTMENFFHFVHLANTFGFQFDLGHKLLRWNSSPLSAPEGMSTENAAAQKAQQNPAHQPMELDETMEETEEERMPPTLTAADHCQKGHHQRRKVSNTSSSGHLTVPSTSRRSSSASTVKAHLSSATVSPVHSNGPAECTSQILSSAQFFPLLAQLPPVQRLNPAIVRQYLTNPSIYDCMLVIYHAKVAQKSYGTEKRFFCPPPCIYLSGEGWRTRRKLLDQLYRRCQLQQNGFKSSPNAFSMGADGGANGSGDPLLLSAEGREKFSELCASMVVDGSDADDKQQQQQKQQPNAQQPIHHMLDFANGKDYSAAKVLFISDTDKRKYFHLHAHFGYAGGALELGVFPSQRIKIISKPSKKKQSMKSSDCKYLCVGNGSKIALFNRLRSQTVSTRYLHVDDQKPQFVASSTKWGAFHINVVGQCAADLAAGQPQHSVTYGSVIQLVDSQTEMRLPLMVRRIRKVDKQNVLLDPSGQGEPVSQLHKCAFQMVDGLNNSGTELFYLCLAQDKIIQYKATPIDANRHQISDGAAWTIISTDKAEFHWAEPFAANGSLSRRPITPVPQLHSVKVLDAQKLLQVDSCRTTDSATIELHGTNFTPSLRVWFGATPTETIFCTKERLSCDVPALYTVCKDLGYTVEDAVAAHASNGAKMAVPLLLARDEDGILFPTGHTFPFQLPTTKIESSALMPPPHRPPDPTTAAEHKRSSAFANTTATANCDGQCPVESVPAENYFTQTATNDNNAPPPIGEARRLLVVEDAAN